jgi:hypothetical protein
MEFINNDIITMFNDFGITISINNNNNENFKAVFFNNYDVSNNGFNNVWGVGGNKPNIYMREVDFINLNLKIDDELIINNKIYNIEEIKDNDYIYNLILKVS